MKKVFIASALLILTLSVSRSAGSAQDWIDTFYQYRVPVAVEVKKAGWNVVPISTSQLITAINKLEEMQYDLRWFDFNQLKVVEVNRNSKVIDSNPIAGFILSPKAMNW